MRGTFGQGEGHELTSCGCGVFLQDADLHRGADEERPNMNSEIEGGERGGRVGSCHVGESPRRCLDGWCTNFQHLAKVEGLAVGERSASTPLGPLASRLWRRGRLQAYCRRSTCPVESTSGCLERKEKVGAFSEALECGMRCLWASPPSHASPLQSSARPTLRMSQFTH